MQDLEGKVIQTTEGTKYVLTEIAGEVHREWSTMRQVISS